MQHRTCGWIPRILTAASACLAGAGVAGAHITPPVVFMTERAAVVALLEGSTSFAVREVRFSSDQRRRIQDTWSWRPEKDFYRFYLGRDERGERVGAVVFMTDYTMHGPIRIALGVAPDGTVANAAVVEVSEETYKWVKPLAERNLMADFAGQALGSFAAPVRLASMDLTSMSRFYAGLLSNVIRQGLVVYEAGFAGG